MMDNPHSVKYMSKCPLSNDAKKQLYHTSAWSAGFASAICIYSIIRPQMNCTTLCRSVLGLGGLVSMGIWGVSEYRYNRLDPKK